MQTKSRLFDEISRVMTGAAGAAQGLRTEIEQLMRSQAERMANELDLVSRDEFDALKALAASAVEEREKLAKRVEKLEAELAALRGGARAPRAKGVAPQRAGRKTKASSPGAGRSRKA